ncbi:hypothetical protein [Paraburkholderia sp.]|uniref:hypothetical protein n=1 Tax=Paraburkholderia sp. TaxID=1926495 RepID=UPI002389B73F|nr:hypothetical protein [Paraburkholderia sp.]MDE1182976.1 hypothetical protein [Paraburkholderia sp.]
MKTKSSSLSANLPPSVSSAERTHAPAAIKVFLTLCLLVACGIAASIGKAPFTFGSGDHALFHAFGHWIAGGQVFTRDFIHFRTPGPYYYYALVQTLMGDRFVSTSFALLAEAHVGQVIGSFFLALAVSKAFWNRASLGLAFCTGVLFLITPPIYQLRTAIPALCLALYIFSLVARPNEGLSQLARLGIVGVVLGMCFWFGQEVFLFLSLAIAAAEFSAYRRYTFKQAFGRLVIIAIGALTPILLGLLYFYSAGVDIRQFLYNTTYYAFFIQPKGMDLPFPPFRFQNAIYYVWLLTYIFAAFAFTLRRKLFHPAAIALIAYTGLRLISMLGRADFLHLLFSISELFILLPVSLFLLVGVRREDIVRRFVPALLVAIFFAVVLRIGTHGSASVLLIIPFVLFGLSYVTFFGGSTDPLVSRMAVPSLASMWAASLAGFLWIFALGYPTTWGTFTFDYDSYQYKPANAFSGVQMSPQRKLELEAVQQEIATRHAQMIFSYPIRAEYYAFTQLHATRFIEFAPQTTPTDVANAIADLQKSRPTLVFRDLVQVAGLSPQLHDLSNYIMTNYTPVRVLQYDTNLEIMVPKAKPSLVNRFYDNVYTYNKNHKAVEALLRPDEEGKTMLILGVNAGSAVFRFPSCEDCVVQIRVHDVQRAATEGDVTIVRDGKSVTKTLSVNDNVVQLPVPAGTGEIEVDLKSHDPQRPVFWRDPMLKARTQ